MNPERRRIMLALGLAPLAAPLTALAQPAPGEYIELDPPLPVETRGKIEVIEFFWYGCPHCYDLEPLLESWAKRLPPDVALRRIPAVFNNPQWTLDAQIFYSLDALGLVERLHRALFDSIHRDHLRTANLDALHEWLRSHKVDVKKFDATMKSFGVQNRLRRSAQLSIAYQITGTPAMAVQGRYTINSDAVRNHQALLSVTDYLIGVVRKGMASKG
ncbi:MAG TPA: thiol:disulfide interchange protein DsbA/DsbL [Burkholderiales bacterium]|nr:thiol:disulfide interchange protein DsbA/DsbL [Burkholderiales bacterium]